MSTVSVLGLGSHRLLEKVADFDIDYKSESYKSKSWAHLIIEVLTWRRRLIYYNIKAKGCGQKANRIGSIAAQKGSSQGIIPAKGSVFKETLANRTSVRGVWFDVVDSSIFYPLLK